MTTIFVLLSEGDPGEEDGQPTVISAHRLISDALSARERYIDESYSGDNIIVQTAGVDLLVAHIHRSLIGDVVETITVQAVELS
jgi:hypothetical protein